MKIIFRNLMFVTTSIILSSSALAQYGPSSGGFPMVGGAGYVGGGSSSRRQSVPKIPDPTGTAFEKVGKLFDAGMAPDIGLLLDNPVLENAVIIFARRPSLLEKDAQVVSFNAGDDVLGPIVYFGTYPMLNDDGSPFDYQKALRSSIANGLFSSPLAYNEEKNALVETLGTTTSTDKCFTSLYVRVTQLENGKRALVAQTVQEDPRRTCNPDGHGGRMGQVSSRGYVVLPD